MKEVQNRSQDSEIESEEEDGDEETQQEQQNPQCQDQELCLLQFLDSTDDYLNLLDALSATLRQGWFELASARHSMGTSRISTALLDMKNHSAATSLRVDERDDGSVGMQPFINLRKWTSSEGGDSLGEEKYNDKLQRESGSPQLRQRNVSDLSDNLGKSSLKKEDALIVDDQVQKERSRTLSTFGTLVSPKLRLAQLSFENALELIVEIANKRIAMLSSFDEVKKGSEDTSSFKQVKEELEDTKV
ncbi:coiled-coil domain-containing protein 115 [Cucumis sativus]|uniref:Vacuolar ATPase assembly protein VMA22 n=1 Tax=Cucumis sativus TaxID=3659 RepID=A0A0A0L4M6_CUCSA|nr:coiled-coil domain-containing protein 115 [Cucumis sativus]KGN55517.1 hypothetical protein Csa_012094 [Cucumis sativus]